LAIIANLANIKGKPMKGMVYVEPAAFRTAAALQGWLEQAMQFGQTLPPKPLVKAAPRTATKK
jgi:hypothetical protein